MARFNPDRRGRNRFKFDGHIGYGFTYRKSTMKGLPQYYRQLNINHRTGSEFGLKRFSAHPSKQSHQIRYDHPYQ